MSHPVSSSTHKTATSSVRSIKLWTATQVGVMTFFLGFPSGIALASINWLRMGLKSKALKYLVGGLAGCIAVILLGVFMPGTIGWVITLLGNLGVMFHLRKQTAVDIQRFTPADTVVQKASWLSGLLVGILALGAAFAWGFVIAFILVILGVIGPPPAV